MDILVIQSILSVDVEGPFFPKETPLRLFSRVAHDHDILFCILTIIININDIPATKITGLKTALMRLATLNIFSNHPLPHTFLLNTLIKIRNGDHMIKIQSSHILIMFAISINKSATVNKNNIKNLRANPSVKLGRAVLPCPIVR